MASFDVVVVGSANTDLISYVPRRPVGGETITGTAFETGFGGKGSNQCVMAAKLGSTTAMVAKLGDDSFGRDTLENYKTNGVNTDSVFITTEAATGVAPIAVDATGENSIIVVPGANNLLSVADVESVRDTITAARVLVCQHEIPLATTLAAMQIAKDAGNVVSIFNPAPAQPPLPDAAFTLPDIFCVNETEAQLFSGVTITDEASAEAAARVILAKGPRTVLVTLGAKGAMVVENDNAAVVVPVEMDDVTVVDTTGAGDAFIGALAHFLATGKVDRAEAIRRANIIAAHSVMHKGTQKSYKSRSELPAALFA